MPRSQRPGIGSAASLSWVKGDERFLTATVTVPSPRRVGSSVLGIGGLLGWRRRQS